MFKRIGRFVKKAPWKKIAKVGSVVVGIEVPAKKIPPPGRIERGLIALRSAIDIPIQWLESKRQR